MYYFRIKPFLYLVFTFSFFFIGYFKLSIASCCPVRSLTCFGCHSLSSAPLTPAITFISLCYSVLFGHWFRFMRSVRRYNDFIHSVISFILPISFCYYTHTFFRFIFLVLFYSFCSFPNCMHIVEALKSSFISFSFHCRLSFIFSLYFYVIGQVISYIQVLVLLYFVIIISLIISFAS